MGAQQRAGFAQAAGVDAGVGEVAEIEVVGRKPDAPCPPGGEQGLGLGGGGSTQNQVAQFQRKAAFCGSAKMRNALRM